MRTIFYQYCCLDRFSVLYRFPDSSGIEEGRETAENHIDAQNNPGLPYVGEDGQS